MQTATPSSSWSVLFGSAAAPASNAKGQLPVTVAFAYRPAGSKTWRRLDVDDSPPYRAFLDPAKFRKNERLQLVAIARSLHGGTATSAVVGFRVHGR
ncbi:MAG TPA: hypothetical protein VLW49_00630 [Gaiellaceae bacterium]|nr:hypothetical protein [Gaiellaceae bacterium]